MSEPTRAHWLNAERLRVYPRIIVALYVVVILGFILATHDHPPSGGNPIGTDFVAFWVGAKLALAGHAVKVFDVDAFVAAQRAFFPGLTGGGFGWFYPPTFLLVLLPFALLPYLGSLFVFLAGSVTAWWLTVRKAFGRPGAGWVAAAFPGLWICVFQGQNGLLTAALAGASLLCLPRRPALAGVFLGLLAIKPHLAVLFAVALVAARAWRTLLVAAGTAVTFLGVSAVVLGGGTVAAWPASLQVARIATEQGRLPWDQMPSTFTMLRLIGTPVAWAYAGHAVVALAAATAVWLVWRRTPSAALRGAVLMAATFLANPYAFDYDLVWLALPIAWLARQGMENGWRRGDREVLLAAWLLPAIAPTIALQHVQVAPFVLGALVWITLRRVLPARPSTLAVEPTDGSARPARGWPGWSARA
ncbi:MAG TPA: glycosyltransferase family 87 protein [Propionicimonas sp.]